MLQIKFSHNWNKKLTQDVFSTIRKYTPEKMEYYSEHLGDTFEIYLNGTYLCLRVLVSVDFRKFHELPLAMLLVDTGLPIDEMAQVFKNFGIENNTQVIVLCFARET